MILRPWGPWPSELPASSAIARVVRLRPRAQQLGLSAIVSSRWNFVLWFANNIATVPCDSQRNQ